MAFRDDKDALVERLTDLERDLKDARDGLDQKDEELRHLRERLGGLDKAPAPRRPAAIVGIVAIALGVVAIAAALWATVQRSPAPTVEALPARPTPLPLALPPPPVAAPPVVPIPTPTTTPTPAPAAELMWKATVRSARGTFASVHAGTRCAVEASATGGAELDLGRVVVRCGDSVLYDTWARATGTMMSQTSGSLRELPAKGGAFVYHLVYQDVGTRSLEARPQLEIGTERRIARLFHEGALGGTLDLAIDKDSQPRAGEPLIAQAE